MQAEYQVENAGPLEVEVVQNKREVMHEATIHFDLARSKTGEQVAHQVNLGKTANDHSNRYVPVDWRKEMMEELAKLMLEKNLITTDLVALVICWVNKSMFVDSIMAKPKPKYFTPPVFKMFEGNLDSIEHIATKIFTTISSTFSCASPTKVWSKWWWSLIKPSDA